MYYNDDYSKADAYYDSLESGICTACGEECHEVSHDDSFDHEFGIEHCSHMASDCCDAPLAEEGSIFLDKTSTHTARKDHVDKDGKVVVRVGHKYRATLRKGYYVDDDGVRHGIFEYTKKEVA